MPTELHFRTARIDDIDGLLDLERRCFQSDRLSRRSFRRFIDAPRDILLVAEENDRLLGYALVLMRKATRLARLYSIAVDPACRGRGLGEKLIKAAEDAAQERDRIIMRLEVRKDNTAAIRLYERLGYHQFETLTDYYEDHEEALRFQKRILFLPPEQDRLGVPFYAQTTDFTCGPAALMMAMATVDREQPMTDREELRIWRRATTIFMMSGHGGCGPHGLALAAHDRGFSVEMVVSRQEPLFLDTVRSEPKKEVLKKVHEDFLDQVADSAIVARYVPLSLDDLQAALAQGRVPVVLINTWQLNRSRVPHWVTLCAVDEQFAYIHDPEVDTEIGESAVDKQYIPVDRGVFERMARYGKQSPLQAAVIVGPRQ